jgi:hypothetical protein
MYRDSELGLCIDVAGPDGNVFNIWATGDMLAKQIGCLEEWRGAVEAAKLMEASNILSNRNTHQQGDLFR